MKKIIAAITATIAITLAVTPASGNAGDITQTATDTDSLAATALSLEEQATEADNSARFEDAYALYNRSLDLYKTIGDWASAARALLKIATVEDRLFRMESSVSTLNAAEQAARISGDEARLFEILVREKKTARTLNRYSDYLRASTSIDSLAGNSSDIAIRREAIADLAETAEEAGDLDKAIRIYNGLLEWQDSMPQSQQRDVVITSVLDKLAYLNLDNGDFEKSLEAARRNVKMKKSGDTKSPIGLALTYHRLSSTYAAMKDTAMAVNYADSILHVASETEQPFYKAYMNLLGGVSFKQTDSLERSVECYTRAMEYPGLEISAHGLIGNVYHRLGGKEKALEHFQKYAELNLARYGERSVEYASALRHVANMKAFNGDLEGGCEAYMNSIAISHDNLRERLRFIPSGMRESLLRDLTESLSLMTPFGISSGHINDNFTTKAYEGLLLTKGLLLASDQSTAGLIQAHGSPDDKADYAEIQRLKNRIEVMQGNPELADSVPSLYHRLLTIDNRLASKCTRYGDIGAFASTTYKDISNALGDKDLLVDFTDYEMNDGGKQYAAFIIRKGMEAPMLIPVCRQAQIDSLLEANDSFISRLYEDEAGESLRALCFDPITTHANEGGRLYIVPSGSLYSISFAAIPLDANTIAGEKYSISRLSSARCLLDSTKISDRRSAMLYGGITYNMDDNELALASIPVDDYMAAAFVPRSPAVHSDTLPYLPYTLTEVKAIAALLSDSVSTVTPLTGKKATEASFISLSGHSPAILHIATHGFYFDPDDHEKAKGLSGITDPMNLSGLVMSGGNAEWTGQQLPPTTLGGLLTAADIARCDLSGTSLVCLSACNTARGSSATSEGLYGLQRAFKKAGAGTLVMSLWEASELSTSIFMNSFYKNLVSNGFKRHAAFRAARAEVRRQFPEPYYWAGFVMVD
ncbi:MAG: CHAT domain-containing protein [Muribaculaceae bacterium]|nr:CHAT domain-containing protein [Muribaculaceae bacterium]